MDVYIDGSCNNKKTGTLPKVGGCGVVFIHKDYIQYEGFGPYENVTSARMEVMGLYQCLRNITGRNMLVTIYCDNQYVVNAKEKNWLQSWIQEYRENGFERPNIDLWDRIHTEIQKLSKNYVFIKLQWVKGHDGNKFNEMADILARSAREKGRISIVGKRSDL